MNSSTVIHQRKSIRLKGYDYSGPGSYFVTICTKRGMCLFGEVENAQTNLSPLGVIAEEEWKNVPAHYLNVRLEQYRIMPNHVHGIIEIVERKEEGAGPSLQKNRVVGTGLALSPLGWFHVIVLHFFQSLVHTNPELPNEFMKPVTSSAERFGNRAFMTILSSMTLHTTSFNNTLS